MGNFEQNIREEQTESEKKYFSKIEQIEQDYKGKKLFPMGEINEISWADLGKTLSIQLSGDVPTNFESVQINIVHPDSENKGWIGIGNIGVTIGGSGVDIGRLPLPTETVNMIKNIYQTYTGQEPHLSFDSNDGYDATKFAVPGLYNNIVEKK